MFQVFVKQAVALLQIFVSANWDILSRLFFFYNFDLMTYELSFTFNRHWVCHIFSTFLLSPSSFISLLQKTPLFPIIIQIPTFKYSNCNVLCLILVLSSVIFCNWILFKWSFHDACQNLYSEKSDASLTCRQAAHHQHIIA